MASPHPALPHQEPWEPEVCHALVLWFPLLLQRRVRQGQVAPRHCGCRMLPPANTSQPHCQDQHQLTTSVMVRKVPPSPGRTEVLGSPGLWGGKSRQQNRNDGDHLQTPRCRPSSQGSSALSGTRQLMDTTEQCCPQPGRLLPPRGSWGCSAPQQPSITAGSLAAPGAATEPKTNLESWSHFQGHHSKLHWTRVHSPTKAGK